MDLSLQKITRWLYQKMRCGGCQASIILSSLSYIGDLKCHAQCNNCDLNWLFAFDISNDGKDVRMVGIVTDLTVEDAKRFKDYEPMTANMVLDWHNYWKVTSSISLFEKLKSIQQTAFC